MSSKIQRDGSRKRSMAARAPLRINLALVLSVLAAAVSSGGTAAVDVGAAATSQAVNSYWAGYLVSRPTGTVNEVGAAWTIPALHATSYDAFSSTWVGIDGETTASTSAPLIQVGTEQDWFATGTPHAECAGATGAVTVVGSAAYSAWWELFPANAEQCLNLSVHPGDWVNATVIDSQSSWVLTVSDLTTGLAASSPRQTAGGPLNAAEWIQELPQTRGTTLLQADYGEVTFDNLRTRSPTIDSLPPSSRTGPDRVIPVAVEGIGGDVE